MRILFVIPYPTNEAPSQRFRFEQYFEILEQANIHYRVSPFWDRKTWEILYKPGHKWSKGWGAARGLMKRFFLLFSLPRYQFVFIHREATPAGPAWFEWTAVHVFRKKIIYDFDDAIWIPAISASNKGFSWVRNFKKVAKICRWSYRISAGNEFLANYARQFNKDVVVVPTVVNTDTSHNRSKDQGSDAPVIGWTGTFSTLHYLDIILPVLAELGKNHAFTFMVIADKDPAPAVKNYRFIKWNKATEIDDLMNFNIGLMPLHDDELSRGKCGFKAIQYMSLGIPALVSPVGVNSKIVDEGINGYLCNTIPEWKKRMEELITDPALRKEMGMQARKKITSHYSVTATANLFLSLFK